MRFAIDAGHGATRAHPHTGAAANGLVEDELALDLIRRIGHHLRAAGHETVYTRPDERLVPLGTRGRRAVASGCDVFLSVHLNAGPPAACGAEAFAVEGDERGRQLAERLLDALASVGLRNRGAKRDSQSQHSRLRVLRDTYRHMPAVLLEVGFLTGSHDASLLRSRRFRENAAKAIARCLVRG